MARYKEILTHIGFKWYANIPQCLDLNIIENVWRILKQRVKEHTCKSIEELKAAILVKWDQISQDEINKLVVTMPNRLQMCWERKGLHTAW